MSHTSTPVCNACRSAVRSSRAWKLSSRSIALSTVSIHHPSRQYSISKKTPSIAQSTSRESRPSQSLPISLASKSPPRTRNIDQKELNAIYTRAQELSISVLAPRDGPEVSEQRTIYVLEQYIEIAKSLVDGPQTSIKTSGAIAPKGSATSALLGSVNTKPSISVTNSMILNHLLQSSEQMITDPKVFINSSILKAYVDLHSLLQRPNTFADVFELYANKPSPKLSSNGDLTLVPARPDHVSAAIHRDTANLALDSAIKAHDMTLALDVIETSFATKAFKRAKILRECAIPGAGLALAPVVAYGVSMQFGAFQTLLDPAQATGIAFAGIMTYVATVFGMGYVAVTTANDQMDRVTWAPGMALSERWVREDERAALDRVAAAWGFKQSWKHGEEKGEDWETLRETCGVKGMVLDRVSLMEGME